MSVKVNKIYFYLLPGFHILNIFHTHFRFPVLATKKKCIFLYSLMFAQNTHQKLTKRQTFFWPKDKKHLISFKQHETQFTRNLQKINKILSDFLDDELFLMF